LLAGKVAVVTGSGGVSEQRLPQVGSIWGEVVLTDIREGIEALEKELTGSGHKRNQCNSTWRILLDPAQVDRIKELFGRIDIW
jgi:chromosome segregation and condensation protein ScpB